MNGHFQAFAVLFLNRREIPELPARTVWHLSCHCPGHVPAGWTTCLPLAQQCFPNLRLPLFRRKSPSLVRLQWRCLTFQSDKIDCCSHMAEFTCDCSCILNALHSQAQRKRHSRVLCISGAFICWSLLLLFFFSLAVLLHLAPNVVVFPCCLLLSISENHVLASSAYLFLVGLWGYPINHSDPSYMEYLL